MPDIESTLQNSDWDIIVVGGGGNAALCAAIEATTAGASVLLLEGAPKDYRGGNSRHTRNFRCMHSGPLSKLTDTYSVASLQNESANISNVYLIDILNCLNH